MQVEVELLSEPSNTAQTSSSFQHLGSNLLGTDLMVSNYSHALQILPLPYSE